MPSARVRGAAEANESLAASFGGREAALEIFLDGELEMSGHFLVEVAIELRAAEQRAHAVERLMKPIGHASGPPFALTSTLTHNEERPWDPRAARGARENKPR